jgi:hypothetical protein
MQNQTILPALAASRFQTIVVQIHHGRVSDVAIPLGANIQVLVENLNVALDDDDLLSFTSKDL